MAYDRGLEERLYEHFIERRDLVVKKMFGGLCFLLSGKMCFAIMGDKLMARVGPENYIDCLTKAYVSEMDFTGKSLKGFVYVSSEGFESDRDLKYWVHLSVDFVDSLPAKQPKKDKKKKQ